ncbi:unnamed protein product [Eruca vesicaria subsp. sativa]|uniref:RNase H type-1 domain-containing protein n=1 Tax=Eruca vesicaria subsp. sativa TaxID=29727 RepID=A0ABC8L6T6_ERUVS|nr:unnamed protein product [Eruca vesicaria subsp. sativa]
MACKCQILGYQEVIIGSDLGDLLLAVKKPSNWPRFRCILQRIHQLCNRFPSVAFEAETGDSNRTAREIAKSVLRDGRFQSYLARGGPAWLHNIINREARRMHS